MVYCQIWNLMIESTETHLTALGYMNVLNVNIPLILTIYDPITFGNPMK